MRLFIQVWGASAILPLFPVERAFTVTAQVSIIIVNWNGREHLEMCLPTVLSQTYQGFAVIVVDNGSTDGSTELLRSRFPSVGLIQNPRNLGFAAANNQAIQASDSPFIATLNNDTRAEPDWLKMLVSAMESHPRVGMCASKMLFADQPGVINSAGICLDRAAIAWDRLGGQPDNPAESETIPIFGPSAGAALYRRAMLDQIGLFDEKFFAYLEDVDLAWRAQRAGWKALYVPQARVYHLHSATGREGSPFKRRQLGRNKVWLIAKNYPTPALYRYFLAILFFDLLAVGYSLLIQRDINAIRGRLEGLAGLSKMRRKRRMVQSQRAHTDASPINQIEPLATPWHALRRFTHLGKTTG
jgi:GT2 family glycosyltransferase